MDKDKNFTLDTPQSGSSEQNKDSSAPRARNRTVMLTPEVTGQVRARLAQDIAQASPRPPADTAAETIQVPPSQPPSGSFYTPPARGKSGVAEIAPVHPTPHRSASHMTPVAPTPSYTPPPPTPHGAELREGVVWLKKTPVVGFLVSFDVNPNGEIFELRSGRLMISSDVVGNGQNYILVKDDSVSMNHAILRISSNGEVQVLDQLSEFGTRIKRFGSDDEIELSGEKGGVEHGDLLYFGKRSFHICLLAQSPSSAAGN